MLELKNISKSFESQLVLDNINLILPNVGLFLIKGKSGIGKTTLFNIISNLDKPSSGEVYYNNIPYSKMNDKAIADLRKDIGFIFQDSNLIDDLTIKDNLELVKLVSKTDVSIEDTLEKLGIYNVINKYPNVLSGGEKQRVAIAIALIKDAKIILADEPTSNLDLETREEVLKILKEISKRRLVLITSHDPYLIGEIENNILLTDLFNKTYNFYNDIAIKEVNRTKVSVLKYFKYSLKLIKKSKFMYIFTSLILLLLVSLSVITFSFYFTNKLDVVLDLFSYYDINKIVIYDKNYSSRELKENILDVEVFRNKYSNTNINQIYLTNFSNGSSSIVYGVVIDESLDFNVVKIDEGLLEYLVVKDNVLNILGFELEVSEIITYSNYEKLNTYNFSKTYNFSLYMNEDTFNELNDIDNIANYYGSYYLNYNFQPLDEDVILQSIYYDNTLADNEVILSTNFENLYQIGDYIKIYDASYKVVGFVTDNVLFSYNVFKKLISEYSYTAINNSIFIGIEFEINEDSIEILNDTNLFESGNDVSLYFIDSPILDKANSLLSFFNLTVKNIVRLVYPLILVFLILMLLVIFYIFYKNYKKDMGFLLSLGQSKINVVLFYFIPISLLLAIVTIISSILVLGLSGIINSFLIDMFSIDTNISFFRLKFLGVFIPFLTTMACFILALMIIYIIFSKKRTIDIIYDR